MSLSSPTPEPRTDTDEDANSDRDAPQSDSQNASLFGGFRLVSSLTLFSRILGLIRDIAMATLFGNGVVLDAFSLAFRIPNMARRLFGEGALSAAFLPALVRELKVDANGPGSTRSRHSAWQFATALLILLASGLTIIVLMTEAVLLSLRWLIPLQESTLLLVDLTALLLPYLVLICVAGQICAILHALRQFAMPAMLPVLLNVVWIVAAIFFVPLWDDSVARVFVIAAAILVAGVVQLLVLQPVLRRYGFRWQSGWRVALPKVRKVLIGTIPIMVGLSVTQLNGLADSLIAWAFSEIEVAVTVEKEEIGAMERERWSVETGTVSALYFGQRLYQFPLGVFGVALSTVLFPQLARHAMSDRSDLLSEDLSRGLRLVILIGFPASVGLFLLAHPLTLLLFEHGAFDIHDTIQTAGMVAAYATAIWAFCGLLIVNRGFYAIDDQMTPLRWGLVAVLMNIVLNIALLYVCGGVGLAYATAITAMAQFVVVTAMLQRHVGHLAWRSIFKTMLSSLIATALMGIVCWLTLEALNDVAVERSMMQRLLRVVLPIFAAVVVYFVVAIVLRMEEVRWLLGRKVR